MKKSSLTSNREIEVANNKIKEKKEKREIMHTHTHIKFQEEINKLLNAQVLAAEPDKTEIKWRRRKWKLPKGKTICVPKTRPRPPKKDYYSVLKSDGADLKHCELCGSDYRVVVHQIESNRDYKLSKAPKPQERYYVMRALSYNGHSLMLSLEPIMDFDLDILVQWIREIRPKFVSIGADSGQNNLAEPSPEKLKHLLEILNKITEVRQKKNLKRLLKGETKK